LSALRRSSLAFFVALSAFLSDWVCGELFMRRGSAANVGLAVLVNFCLFAIILLGVRLVAPSRAIVAALRIFALLILTAILIQSGRAALGPDGPLSLLAKTALLGLILLAVFYVVLRSSEVLNDRLMRAVILASIAFVASPFMLRAFAAQSIAWPPALPELPPASIVQAVASHKQGVMFLLLDELGYPAAAPLASDLRDLGLQVSYQRLKPGGANTLNVIPTMFTHRNFDQARPCGRSTVCSGADWLDFSRIHAARSDMDVTGLLHPYCDIADLRSCYQLELPHEFGNAFTGLLAFYARRFGVSLPAPLAPSAEPGGLQGRLLARQLAFVDGARFWREGGVLYAHLAIPHPPGLNETSTLDQDYASNIEASRTLLKRWTARLKAEFGENFSVIITSDHPLRHYWCSSGIYKPADCKTRDEFQTDLVPLIVASTSTPARTEIKNNSEVFDALAFEARRLWK